MLAVVSAYLKHNQKNYYFTDSVLCNINSKKEGYKYAEELECTLIDNMLGVSYNEKWSNVHCIILCYMSSQHSSQINTYDTCQNTKYDI